LNKWLVAIAFSVLLLVPVGAQQVFAQPGNTGLTVITFEPDVVSLEPTDPDGLATAQVTTGGGGFGGPLNCDTISFLAAALSSHALPWTVTLTDCQNPGDVTVWSVDENGVITCIEGSCLPPPSPEVCDNGVDDDLDGDVDCNDSDCSLDPVCNTDICGDGIVEGTEQCDSLNPPLPTATCDINCQLIAPPFCGDGLVNAPGEQCDSLNPPLPTATCDISCMTIPPSCGLGTTPNVITTECEPDVTQADLDSVEAQRDAILATLFEFLRVFGVI